MPNFKQERKGFKMKGWSAFTKKDKESPYKYDKNLTYTSQNKKNKKGDHIKKMKESFNVKKDDTKVDPFDAWKKGSHERGRRRAVGDLTNTERKEDYSYKKTKKEIRDSGGNLTSGENWDAYSGYYKNKK
tara:strand:+ start:4207 stop:4596 length:390 start_codon:yes stop_codon:yes gene_type:complete